MANEAPSFLTLSELCQIFQRLQTPLQFWDTPLIRESNKPFCVLCLFLKNQFSKWRNPMKEFSFLQGMAWCQVVVNCFWWQHTNLTPSNWVHRGKKTKSLGSCPYYPCGTIRQGLHRIRMVSHWPNVLTNVSVRVGSGSYITSAISELWKRSYYLINSLPRCVGSATHSARGQSNNCG